MIKTLYSVGFAFTANGKEMAAILKNRPKWQNGKRNGIGGHVEAGEQPAQAQSREFYEEAGVLIAPEDWHGFAILEGEDWMVTCFSTFTDDVRRVLHNLTDEGLVECLPVEEILAGPIIPNLRYLVPLALDKDQTGAPCFIYYK